MPGKITTILAAALIGVLAPLTMAQAEPQAKRCVPRDKVVEVLGKKFKEHRRGIGLVADRMIMEVYVAESGSWTILVTGANGISCIVVAGEAWEDIPLPQTTGLGI